LGVPYRFNQLNLLSKKTLRPRSPASQCPDDHCTAPARSWKS
jgi:hypothetical protein